MSMSLPVTLLDKSAMDLRREASRCIDGVVVRGLLAIALVLEGRPRTVAARACGMDRWTLRDRVHRYNADAPGDNSVRHLDCSAEIMFVPACTRHAPSGLNRHAVVTPRRKTFLPAASAGTGLVARSGP